MIRHGEADSMADARWVRTTLRWVGRHPAWMGAVILVAVLVTVGVTGGLSAGPGSPRSSTSAAGPGVTAAGSANQSAAAGTRTSSGAATASGATSTGAATAKSAALPTLPSKVVKTGSLDLQVAAGRLMPAMNQMGRETTALGGFVASSSTITATPGTAASGDITLRVPVQSFNTLLTDMQHLGRASSVSTSGRDVTAQYVDLQARIQSLEAARNQFRQILTRAQTIADILAVEQQITSQQTQIEQLQGQLKVLDDQSSYSTLSVHVVDAAAGPQGRSPRTANGLARAWHHALHSFTRGAESIVAFSGGLVLFLLVLGALALLARLVWFLARRRAAATAPVTAPPE